jgi:outer membrane protein OmpA-like peptidoglycan-associated protein
MRLLGLLLSVSILHTASFSQAVKLKYGHLAWNIAGSFNAPNFNHFLKTYNAQGPKPPSVSNYGFRRRPLLGGAVGFLSGFSIKGSGNLITVSFMTGGPLIDLYGDYPAKTVWDKSLRYEHHDLGIGYLGYMFNTMESEGLYFPRVEYQVSFNREFNLLSYKDNQGTNIIHQTSNFGVSSFIQYNFYTPPYKGDGIRRVVFGINLRYHMTLQPVDFSPLQRDLNFNYNGRLADNIRDLTLGFSLTLLSCPENKNRAGHRRTQIERRPERVSLLKVSVVDSRTGRTIFADLDVVDQLRKKQLPFDSGFYKVRSLYNKMPVVYITASARGYYVKKDFVENFDSPQTDFEVMLEKINPKSPIGIFYFERSTVTLTDSSRTALYPLVETLRENKQVTISIEGHTSAEASSAKNQSLSLRRAKVIRKFLANNGIDISRIFIEGRGASDPRMREDTEEHRAQNRRVEVFIENK